MLTTSTPGPQTLADRYIALWTEPDEQARRAAIRALWAPGGAHVLQPPAEMVKIAAELGLRLAVARGSRLRGHRKAGAAQLRPVRRHG